MIYEAKKEDTFYDPINRVQSIENCTTLLTQMIYNKKFGANVYKLFFNCQTTTGPF